MPTGPQFLAALAPISGIHPATLDRYMRELRAARLVRRSGKGGGKSGVALTAYEETIVLLSLVASGPGDAADAAKRLRVFEYYRSHPQAASPRLKGNLGTVIEAIIHWDDPALLGPDVYLPEMVACLNPPWVELIWPDANGLPALAERYGPPIGKEYTVKPMGVTRQTRVAPHMFRVASELLRDIDQAPASASTEPENAGPPAREPAPSRDQDRQNDPVARNAPEGRAGGERPQARSKGDPGRISSPTRSDDHADLETSIDCSSAP